MFYGSKGFTAMLGGKKAPIQEEQVTIDFAYATVVTIADIKAGDVFTTDNVWVKRPGTGQILAKDFEQILGKIAKVDISTDTHLTWDMIE